MSSSIWPQTVADVLDALGPNPSANEVYDALLNFDTRYAAAAIAAQAYSPAGSGTISEITSDDDSVTITGGTGPTADLSVSGGSQSVKHVVVGIDYTDIDNATGLADLYLMPDNETLVALWVVVTEVFDGVDSGMQNFAAVQAYAPGGSVASSMALSDSFTTQETSASDPNGGMIYAGPGQSSPTLSNLPMAAPVPGGGSLQLVVDFVNASGTLLPADKGSAGHLDLHLVLAVAP